VLKNTLLARDKDVSPAVQARKCLNRRERVRTCAGLAALKKVWTTFFNILPGSPEGGILAHLSESTIKTISLARQALEHSLRISALCRLPANPIYYVFSMAGPALRI